MPIRKKEEKIRKFGGRISQLVTLPKSIHFCLAAPSSREHFLQKLIFLNIQFKGMIKFAECPMTCIVRDFLEEELIKNFIIVIIYREPILLDIDLFSML